MHNTVKMRKKKYDVTRAGLNLIQQSKLLISFSLVSCFKYYSFIEKPGDPQVNFAGVMGGPLMLIGGPGHPAPAQFKHCLSLPKKGGLGCGTGELFASDVCFWIVLWRMNWSNCVFMCLLTCFLDKRDWLAASRDNFLVMTNGIMCHFCVGALETKQNLKSIVQKWNEQESSHFADFCQMGSISDSLHVFKIRLWNTKYYFVF